MTIPPSFLLALPATTGAIGSLGNLSVMNEIESTFKAPGVDFAQISYNVFYDVSGVEYK